ncbi:MAG: hypothetical protein JJE25_01945, partial [Bacteroidia bacterium]|nr:hypothetical protein [Bacteroidia bacterium]
GIGGSLRYEMPVGDNLGLMFTAGYLAFGGDEVTSGVPGIFALTVKSSSALIPLQVGAKYYFSEQQDGFYGAVQLGLTLISSSTDITTDFGGTKTTTSATGSASGFSYAPGIGYHLSVIDIGLNYQLFSQTTTVSDPFTGASFSATSTGSYLGLRLAYVFGEK